MIEEASEMGGDGARQSRGPHSIALPFTLLDPFVSCPAILWITVETEVLPSAQVSTQTRRTREMVREKKDEEDP